MASRRRARRSEPIEDPPVPLCRRCNSRSSWEKRMCGNLAPLGLCLVCISVYDERKGPRCPECGLPQLNSHDYNIARCRDQVYTETRSVGEQFLSSDSETLRDNAVSRRHRASDQEGKRELDSDSDESETFGRRATAQEPRGDARAANSSRREVYDGSDKAPQTREDRSIISNRHRSTPKDNIHGQSSADTGQERSARDIRSPRATYDERINSQRRPVVSSYGRHGSSNDRGKATAVPGPGSSYENSVEERFRPATDRDDSYDPRAESRNTTPASYSRYLRGEEAGTSRYSSPISIFPTTTGAGNLSTLTRTSGPQPPPVLGNRYATGDQRPTPYSWPFPDGETGTSRDSFRVSSFPTTTGVTSFSTMTRTSGVQPPPAPDNTYSTGDRGYSDREQQSPVSVIGGESRQTSVVRSPTPPNAGLEGSTIGVGLAGVAVGAVGTLMWCTAAIKGAVSRR